MTKKNTGTGGSTQAININSSSTPKKPPKPKVVARITLNLLDNGAIDGDFIVWNIDENDIRRPWRCDGEDFFKFVYAVQPKNVRVLASCCNVQIVAAGLPEDCQGPWLTLKGSKDGQTRVLGDKDEINALLAKLVGSAPPVNTEVSTKLIESANTQAEKAAGLAPRTGAPPAIGG